MIWLICAIIAAVMVLMGMSTLFNKHNGSLRVIFILMWMLLATYVAYIPAYIESYGLLSGLVGNLNRVLQVVTIDANIVDYYEVAYASIGAWADGYTILLAVLHVAVPTSSALSAVAVLFRCYSSVQLYFAGNSKKPIFIFSEMNERSLHLAKSLENLKCQIVFANCDEDARKNEDGNKRRYIYKDEPISELNLRSRRGKEIHLFCISEDEDISLTYTLQLLEKLTKLNSDEQAHFHIYQFAKHRDYSVYIDSAHKGSLDVQCINEYEQLVYKLLDEHPLYECANSQIHVLLHGLSPINVCALKAIAWCGQLGEYSLRISVVGVNIQDREEQLKLQIPGLFSGRYQIKFHSCQNEKQVVDVIKDQCADANYIIISEDSDNDTMECGIELRRQFYHFGESMDNCPPIYCYIKEPAKYNIVKSLATAESNPNRKMGYDLTPFGSLSEVFTYERLVDSDLEKLAKNVHLAYEEIFSDGPIDVEAALKKYNVFEVDKRSNRAAALHIRYKLNQLGLDYTKDRNVETVALKDYYTEESIEKLAIAEHDRWVAFQEAEGWTRASREEVLAYQKSGISKGRHKCPLLKMHPYICDYSLLKDLSEELEGKNTTVYDWELVRRIPDILGDKWNVAGRKYNIIKRK